MTIYQTNWEKIINLCKAKIEEIFIFINKKYTSYFHGNLVKWEKTFKRFALSSDKTNSKWYSARGDHSFVQNVYKFCNVYNPLIVAISILTNSL